MTPFGGSRIDTAVMRWMDKNGIHCNLVSRYVISRDAHGKSEITLTMQFEDEPDVPAGEE